MRFLSFRRRPAPSFIVTDMSQDSPPPSPTMPTTPTTPTIPDSFASPTNLAPAQIRNQVSSPYPWACDMIAYPSPDTPAITRNGRPAASSASTLCIQQLPDAVPSVGGNTTGCCSIGEMRPATVGKSLPLQSEGVHILILRGVWEITED